ncbi:BTAD domain-containing putative transcriptional regulator [Amycolatopsis minnesotensis]|uniref:OmpR/PhoB-type domain-containing protein n=1 Tax=Amycolatopsis minnesotensis TaxID=337894 RepID=A0ABP5C7T4_9PSEU
MHFQLLGPLELVDHGRPLSLSGIKQRATLGFLLLHVNSVVATSQLLKALWPDGMPPTGRKMLQNAVSGLRGILSAGGDGPDSPVLLTHAPGYLLRVDPEQVDLSRFHHLVNSGRADLAAGSWQQAARTLREALALWRGPVLADLVEHGVDWPELAAVRNTRLTALEDCVEAEFAAGRHGEVINELETWVEVEPLRERLCGQLMRALYHCGRQVDALGVYRRTRTRLIDELGLDPGRELQDLERAILNQEPLLPLPQSRDKVVQPRPPRVAGYGAAYGVSDQPAPRLLVPPVPPPGGTGPEPLVPAVVPVGGGSANTAVPAAELKRVSAVLVLTRFDRDVGEAPPEDVERVLRGVATVVREEVEHAGGLIGGRVASLWMAVFGSVRSCEDDAARAVRTALATRERLGAEGALSDGMRALTVTVAVATGEALVRPAGEYAHRVPEVTGGVLDRCLRLLAHVSPGEVRVCGETRKISEPLVAYDGEHDPVRGSRVLAGRPPQAEPGSTGPFVNRDRELGVLLGVLDQVARRSGPHLVTVLGEAGVGKSRLIAEFERAVAKGVESPRLLVGRTPRFGQRSALAALVEGFRPYVGVTEDDPDEVVAEKLATAVRGLAGAGSRASWLLSHLRFLFGLDGVPHGQRVATESFLAWGQFLEEVSGPSPLVVVIEDLQWAADCLLDFVDYVTAEASFPLLVVITARPELLDRRHSWGGGKARANTITLDPLSDDDATRLLTLLCVRQGIPVHDQHESADDVTAAFRAVIAYIGGNPLFTVAYAKMLRENGPVVLRRFRENGDWSLARPDGSFLPLPPLVQRITAAMIDSLPPSSKAVLLDAAVLGENVCETAVVAVGDGAVTDVPRALQYLERRELLRRARGSEPGVVGYTFRYPLIRDVAYRSIPRSARAEKHQRVAEWLEGLPGQHSQALAYHYRCAAEPEATGTAPAAEPAPHCSPSVPRQRSGLEVIRFGPAENAWR